MSIELNGTTGITTPDVNVTANITAVDATLSGGVYVGGTAAANKLDDYEEGTWTPTITAGYTSITYTSQTGWYRKVGSLVTFGGRIQFYGTANSLGVSASAPFTMGAAGYGGGGIPYSNVAVITNTDPYINQNASEIKFYTKGTGDRIISSGNVSNQYISFVVSMYI